VNQILWIMRTGAPGRDLPVEFPSPRSGLWLAEGLNSEHEHEHGNGDGDGDGDGDGVTDRWLAPVQPVQAASMRVTGPGFAAPQAACFAIQPRSGDRM
jgi:hypothetical protein